MTSYTIQSPIGPLTLTEAAGALVRLDFGPGGAPRSETELLRRAGQELAEYFAGTRRRFTVPLRPEGTPFQRAVWAALAQIPYGETVSYAQLAQRIGRPSACRAVGMANHRNPLPILLPCHRCIGSGGQLTGYAGGLEVKRFLLELERGVR